MYAYMLSCSVLKLSARPTLLLHQHIAWSSRCCYALMALQVHLVLERLPGGDLLDHLLSLHHLSERQAAGVLRQVLKALEHCHARWGNALGLHVQ
jgi:serine/threonine protein kinase